MRTNPTGLPERIHVLPGSMLVLIRLSIAFFVLLTVGALWILRDPPPDMEVRTLYGALVLFPLAVYVLVQTIRRRERYTIAYDEEGIWRFAEPRTRALVRWKDVAHVVTSDQPRVRAPLILRNARGEDLLLVSRALEDYATLEMVICIRAGRPVETANLSSLKYALG